MTVGVLAWELEIVAARSLKQKRAVVRSVTDRLRSRFNLSVAETGHQDTWQRAEIAVCGVSNDRRHLESLLDKADQLVDTAAGARVIDSYRIFY